MSVTSYVLKIRGNGSVSLLSGQINSRSIYTKCLKNFMFKIYMKTSGNYKTGMKNNIYKLLWINKNHK